MNDPTILILGGTFLLALLVFVIPASLRAAKERSETGGSEPVAPDAGLPPLFPGIPSDPYETPRVEPAPTPPPLPAGTIPLWPYRRFDMLGMACVFGFFALLVLVSAATASKAGLRIDAGTLLVNIAFQFVLAGVVSAVMFWRIRPAEWLGLRWRQWPWVFLIAPATVVVMWMVFGGLHASGYVKWMESLGSETVQETVKLLQESKDPLVIGLMAATAVFVAPVCEEVVFRGYFYPVAKRFAGAWPAALCSAMVFAAAHGNLTALLPLFLFGLALVFIYEKTGSLWAPVAVHFCFNGATVVAQLAVRYLDIPVEQLSR